jgi:hypothetical protein
MKKPMCLCGSKYNWISVETVILPENNGGKEQRTGIFSYNCSCGSRIPYAVWVRATESEEAQLEPSGRIDEGIAPITGRGTTCLGCYRDKTKNTTCLSCSRYSGERTDWYEK